MQTLTAAEWRPLAEVHASRVDAITKQVLARKRSGERHPIEDFLWSYYSLRPSQLRIWHPGIGFRLERAPEYEQVRGYLVTDGCAEVDPEFIAARSSAWLQVLQLLKATAGRAPRFGCLGLHEWAMVYKLEQSEVRHEQAPLRLSPTEIAQVVEHSELQCSHIDAFRFFTPAAAPRNRFRPTRAEQAQFEQPGCIHANMDLYKWCYKLLPAVSSDLLMQAFELAYELRRLDMQAAPYDLTEWGLAPIKLETAEGKLAYTNRQKELASRAIPVRDSLIREIQLAISPQGARSTSQLPA